MGELGELRSRVDQAVDRLSTANDTRKRQSHGLMTLLTDLEGKYEARSEELEHCRQRIAAFGRNGDLSHADRDRILAVWYLKSVRESRLIVERALEEGYSSEGML